MFLSKDDLEKIYQHAVDDYPDECCGIVIAPPDKEEGSLVYHCTNIQNKMHEQDPVSYPRMARTAYLMDPQEQYKIISEADKKGMVLKVFYHSHIDCEAYFSETDQREALFDDEPTYPETAYLVVSVIDRQVRGVHYYLWDDKKKEFGEHNLENG